MARVFKNGPPAGTFNQDKRGWIVSERLSEIDDTVSNVLIALKFEEARTVASNILLNAQLQTAARTTGLSIRTNGVESRPKG